MHKIQRERWGIFFKAEVIGTSTKKENKDEEMIKIHQRGFRFWRSSTTVHKHCSFVGYSFSVQQHVVRPIEKP
jgi:hypothetical protein